LSAAGIPQVAVVHGNATAGGAYQPGLSDYVIAVRKQTEMSLNQKAEPTRLIYQLCVFTTCVP